MDLVCWNACIRQHYDNDKNHHRIYCIMGNLCTGKTYTYWNRPRGLNFQNMEIPAYHIWVSSVYHIHFNRFTFVVVVVLALLANIFLLTAKSSLPVIRWLSVGLLSQREWRRSLRWLKFGHILWAMNINKEKMRTVSTHIFVNYSHKHISFYVGFLSEIFTVKYHLPSISLLSVYIKHTRRIVALEIISRRKGGVLNDNRECTCLKNCVSSQNIKQGKYRYIQRHKGPDSI